MGPYEKLDSGRDGVDCLRQEVVNLRTGATFPRNLWIEQDGLETLQRWQDELDVTMRALDDGRGEDGLYKVAPGGGCIGCPYVAHCEPGKAWWRDALGFEKPEDVAIAYAVAVAKVRSLTGDRGNPGPIRKLTAEHPVAIPGGKVVGTVAKEGRAVAEDSWQLVAEAWAGRGGEAGGLVRALGIGVSQLDNIADVLYPDLDDKENGLMWVRSLVEPKISRRFGIHKTSPDVESAEELMDDPRPPACDETKGQGS